MGLTDFPKPNTRVLAQLLTGVWVIARYNIDENEPGVWYCEYIPGEHHKQVGAYYVQAWQPLPA